MNNTKLSLKLFQSWKKWDLALTANVMSQQMCDISPEFMCFADIYYNLSKIIPRHWTILDLGCAYAPQCYYFGKHKKYIGVDHSVKTRFEIPGSDMYFSSIKDFFQELIPKDLNLSQTFGIMSYVPAKEEEYLIAKQSLKNLFVYYPSLDPTKMLKYVIPWYPPFFHIL